jgi:hypothetical protein
MKIFKRTDLIVILGILVVSAASWVFNTILLGRTSQAEIYYESELVETVELSGERIEPFPYRRTKM